ncbi:type II secretion system F family protein [Phenylobacterium soli]|uniref:Type II secretion system F family protein n=1 Tax=Phenylobacterium soli TaxID=2170551 RepID=A0A328AB30_9CAUL|nr:type II secretion system F family protein [Phenylobacterium soli]RAK51830.1 type II secretion system F family protein [Phenylobacterium soli]
MSLPALPFGAHGALLLGLVVGAVNFRSVLSVMRALSPPDLVAARARSHARRRSELRARRLTPKRAGARQSIGLARALLQRLKLDRGGEADKVADQLARAGWRSRDAVVVFLTLRLAAPFVVGLAAYVLGPSILHFSGGSLRMLVTAGGALAGSYLPTVLLRNGVERRQKKIQKGLPDALDLFVICAEAGLTLDAAVTRVAREMGAAAPELADELGLTAIELGFLPDRREALQNLARRVGTSDVAGLVGTLVQTEKYGTPLAQALRVLAAEFRDTRMMRAEEKAARLPATLTVPMIVFVLPPLFVVLIGPAILQALAVSWH